jgi:hypothetical protein
MLFLLGGVTSSWRNIKLIKHRENFTFFHLYLPLFYGSKICIRRKQKTIRYSLLAYKCDRFLQVDFREDKNKVSIYMLADLE